MRASRQQNACWRESYAAAVRLDESLAHIALQLAKLLRYRRRGQIAAPPPPRLPSQRSTPRAGPGGAQGVTFHGSYTVCPMTICLCLTVHPAMLDR